MVREQMFQNTGLGGKQDMVRERRVSERVWVSYWGSRG
ncbi:hypothetical protein E2C01_002511 [Portunus trituberculatus]|uniref:Uncharacterized protein n=1 Tax=Portunus trituberculatus TaxID=210409 RepID=A0A5B7CMG3_PORTR|nr:hypothetical protein [Portunus trituberculatus]